MHQAMIARLMVPAAIFACATGCADKRTGPVRASLPFGVLPALIVSEPVNGVAYISLPLGSVYSGGQAIIRNQTNGKAMNTPLSDGGFDPVPLSAAAGDTLVVQITTPGTVDSVSAARVVKDRQPPVVVRTNPPGAKTDVPVSGVVLVVFSVPIGSATLNAGSVQLWRDTTRVTGTVRFSDPTQIKAEFHPDSVLAGGATYRLVISETIADMNGLQLEAPVTVQFATAVSGTAAGGFFSTLTAGANHTCAVRADGAAYCWGDNTYGMLGDGSTTSSSVPVRVAGGITFARLSAGWTHTCGLTADGKAYCWGNNDGGQLGDGTTMSRTAPVPVAGDLSFFDISVGGTHTCAVTAETVDSSAVTYCWGSNAAGQIGDATIQTASIPRVVKGVWGQFLSAGRNHNCVVDPWDIGTTLCWGANDGGQLDDGTNAYSPTPIQSIGVPCGPPGGSCPFGAISSGGSHSCAQASGYLYQTFSWYCWGANDNGQLGDGSTINRTSPVPVGGGMAFAPYGVSAGGHHTCGVSSAFRAYCWGLNSDGQLGDGTTAQRSSPNSVSGGLRFVSVTAGKESHSCGWTDRGDAYCWGANSHGQLGNGTTVGSAAPVKVLFQR